MGFFTKKTHKSEPNVKFVGAYVPLQINEYFTLYSLATGESRQGTIINLIKNFKEEMEVDLPKDELIEQVVIKGFESWKIERKKSGYSRGMFFILMHKQLLKMGIEHKTILIIIDKVKNETNKIS